MLQSTFRLEDANRIQPNETMTVINVLVGIIFPSEARVERARAQSVISDTSVSRDRAEAYASNNDMKYIEVNISDMEDIDKCFASVVEMMISSRRNMPCHDCEDSIRLDQYTYNKNKSTPSSASCGC